MGIQMQQTLLYPYLRMSSIHSVPLCIKRIYLFFIKGRIPLSPIVLSSIQVSNLPIVVSVVFPYSLVFYSFFLPWSCNPYFFSFSLSLSLSLSLTIYLSIYLSISLSLSLVSLTGSILTARVSPGPRSAHPLRLPLK